jgi:hypothetical protein
LAAGDDCIKVDYAHESTGFPTWHRQYLLWVEWEIQYMLKGKGTPDYQDFRLNYWDWRYRNRTGVFAFDKLGVNVDSTSNVQGELFSNGWDTICWYREIDDDNVNMPKGTVCDPTLSTGSLKRCPIINGINSCLSPSNWPYSSDVDEAINKPAYDTSDFGRSASTESFRNLVEGFDTVPDEVCNNDRLCKDDIRRYLHNAVSGLEYSQSTSMTRN